MGRKGGGIAFGKSLHLDKLSGETVGLVVAMHF